MKRINYQLLTLVFLLFSLTGMAQNKDTIVFKGNTSNWGINYSQISIAINNSTCTGYVYDNSMYGVAYIDSMTGDFADTLIVDDSVSTGLAIFGHHNSPIYIKLAYDLSKSYNEIIINSNNIEARGHLWGNQGNSNLKSAFGTYQTYNVAKFYWDFGDSSGIDSSGNIVVHQYANEGRYAVRLTAVDSSGTKFWVTDSLVCIDSSAIDYCPTHITINNTAINKVTAKVHGYLNGLREITYDFGDGTTFSTTNSQVQHTYNQSGQYIVCVTYKDSLDCELSYCDTITACNINFKKANPIYTSNTLKTFDFGVQVIGGTNLKYAWDFGDGSAIDSSEFPTHTYGADSIYVVKVTVIDSSGCFIQTTKTIDLRGCTFNNVSYSFTDTGDRYRFTADVDSSSILTTYTWFLDDFYAITGNKFDYHYYYATTGYHKVCLRVTRGLCTVEYCDSIYICGIKTALNASVAGNNSIYANGIVSGLDSSNLSQYNYSWYINDSLKQTGTSKYFNYQLQSSGAYEVCFEVNPKDSGCLQRSCQTVDACFGNPYFDIHTVDDDSFSFIIDSVPSSYTYSWFIDSVFVDTGNIFDHKFPADGRYQICAEVSPYDSGCIQRHCENITICRGKAGFGVVEHSVDSFTFTISNPVSAYTYTWYVNDVQVGTGTSYSNKFADGAYTIKSAISPSSSVCSHESYRTIIVCKGWSGFNYTKHSKDSFTFAMDTAVTGYTYTWKSNGNIIGTGATLDYEFTSNGLYTICAEMSPSDSICKPITCENIQICLLNANFTNTPGAGNSRTFKALHTGSGYVYIWNFGDGNRDSGISSTISHTYAASGKYYTSLTIYDPASGCRETVSRVFNYNHPNGLCIRGKVFLDSSSVSLDIDSAIVYLIEHDSSAGTLIALDSTYIHTADSNKYEFCGLLQGNYLIKAALINGDPSYNDNIPTYYKSSTQWSGATEIAAWHTIGGRNIWMVGGTNLGGPGFIGGLISAGANKTNNLNDLIITVILKDANGNPIAYRKMDANHKFSFDGLPYGTYKLAIDIPGKTTAEYTIVLSTTNPKKEDADFIVKSTNILTSVKSIPFTISNSVYPNPADDVLNVDLDVLGTQNITLELIDMQGRVLVTQTYDNVNGAGTYSINTETINAGVYMLKINVDDYSIINKVVINK